jgi:redox-sensitive bicupin YhaK (pirin superfamily)
VSIDRLLPPRSKDLGGGFTVRRLLPASERQTIGPFIFFDHFGPLTSHPGDNHDVRPHPHIGLATVTYLFKGAMMHRDNLGFAQRIEPGAINWMTAGRGIVHSERAPEDLRPTTYDVHGLQLWAALPGSHEETAPAFHHTAADAIPVVTVSGARVRVLVGDALGAHSPVATFAPTLYLDVEATAGTKLVLDADAVDPQFERGVYSVGGGIEIDGKVIPPHTMAVLVPGTTPTITSPDAGRYVIVGGAPMDGPRFIWWNFVSSRKDRIEQAKADWSARRMDHIPGETEWIPLPPN